MWFAHLLIYYTILLSFLFAFKTKYKSVMKNIYIFLMAGFMIFFSTLRYPKYGTDTLSYLDILQKLSSGYNYTDLVLYEPGFLLFTKFISLFTLNFQIYLLIVNLIIFYVVFDFIIKYSSSIWLSAFLVIGMEYYDQSMNLLRQILALILVLSSYKYLINKKYIVFFIYILIASQFHYTSFVFVVTVLLHRITISKKNVLIYFMILVVSFMFSGTILNYVMSQMNIYDQYLESDYYNIVDEPKLACILHLLIDLSILLLGYISKCYAKTELSRSLDNNFMMKLIMIGSIFWALSVNFSTIGRVAMYFDVFSIVFIPNAIYSIKSSKSKVLIVIMTVMFFSVKYFVISYFRPGWAGVYPYNFFFNQ